MKNDSSLYYDKDFMDFKNRLETNQDFHHKIERRYM